MGNDRQDPDKRGNDRVDLHREIRLKFLKFQDFLTEIAGNVSPGGMFINTESPHEPGELFEFQCSLDDGFPLVGGRAEVVWARRSAASDAQPAGMGVRFLELYENSRELIEKIVEQRLKAGEEAFDLERERAMEKARVDSVLPKSPAAPPPRTSDIEDDILAATERLTEVPIEPSPPPSAPRREAPPDARPQAGPEAPPEMAPTATPREPPPAAPSRAAVSSSGTGATARPPAAPPGREREPPKPRAPSGAAASIKPPPPLSHGRAAARPPAVPVAAVASRSPRLSFRRLGELGVISILVGGGMVLAFHQYWVRPRIESLESKLGELTGASGVPASPGIEPLGGTEVDAPPDVAEREVEATATSPQAGAEDSNLAASPNEAPASTSATETVQAWARAWSGRRVDEYLAYYSAEFVPASGGSRQAWEARRRDRLLNQGAIRVAVVSMAVEEVSPTDTRVTFTQSYRSETFRDRVRKTLRLVREEGDWKIAEELVVRQLPW